MSLKVSPEPQTRHQAATFASISTSSAHRIRGGRVSSGKRQSSIPPAGLPHGRFLVLCSPRKSCFVLSYAFRCNHATISGSPISTHSSGYHGDDSLSPSFNVCLLGKARNNAALLHALSCVPIKQTTTCFLVWHPQTHRGFSQVTLPLPFCSLVNGCDRGCVCLGEEAEDCPGCCRPLRCSAIQPDGDAIGAERHSHCLYSGT